MAVFINLTEINDPSGKEEEFLNGNHRYVVSDKVFQELDSVPYNAYWLGETLMESFREGTIEKYANCCTGMQTGANGKYIRYWFEPNFEDTTICKSSGKFEKYNCGGENRRWYGNHFNVIYWENNGQDVRNEKSSVIRNEKFFRKAGISWKRISSGSYYLRFLPEGFIFDQAGDSMFPSDPQNINYLLGLLNSKVIITILKFIAPGTNLTAGNMNRIPVIFDANKQEEIEKIVDENVTLAKGEWDEFETSWDFRRHPLI